jgi:hypothetical protein
MVTEVVAVGRYRILPVVNSKETAPTSPLQPKAQASATTKQVYERMFDVGHGRNGRSG